MTNVTKKIMMAIPAVRLIFPHIVEKTPIDGKIIKHEEDRSYSATFLLSKDNDDHKEFIKDYCSNYKKILESIFLEQNPHVFLKDGDQEYKKDIAKNNNDESAVVNRRYKKNSWIIKATNKFKPILTHVNRKLSDKLNEGDPDEIKKNQNALFYSGCYVHAYIELYPYKFQNNWRGVSNRLHQIQFCKNGENIGGVQLFSATELFNNNKFKQYDDNISDIDNLDDNNDLDAINNLDDEILY